VTTVAKPEGDARRYRAVDLPNGLQVLLGSHPDADVASVALSVRCGSFQDPPAYSGLAHLLEHALFLGTERYPRENELQRFLNVHGGQGNAHTSEELTTFHFHVLAGYLVGALDRFASLFICPTLDSDALTREILTIDSESADYACDEGWRMLQVVRGTASEAHPFRQFGVGDMRTLGKDPHETCEELRAWHAVHYQAGAMKLVVLGREALDDLQVLVEWLFAAVPCGTGRPWAYPCPIWHDTALGRIVAYAPLCELRMLAIYWPLQPLGSRRHAATAELYLAHTIARDGAGSLQRVLASRGLADGLSIDNQYDFSDCKILIIRITLTPEGDQNHDRVLSLLFTYLAFLRHVGPCEDIFQELKQLSNTIKCLRDDAVFPPDGFAASAAEALHRCPPHDVVCQPPTLSEWEPELIAAQLQALLPERCLVVAASPSHTQESVGPEAAWWNKDPWYGAAFRDFPIPVAKLRLWSASGVSVELTAAREGFALPLVARRALRGPPRLGLATCGIGIGSGSRQPDLCTAPRLVLSSPSRRLWHKLDTAFCTPRATFLAKIVTNPLHASAGPDTAVALRLFCLLLRDDLQEHTHSAAWTGLQCGVQLGDDHICLEVGGLSERLVELTGRVAGRLSSLLTDLEEATRGEEAMAMSREDERCPFELRGGLLEKELKLAVRLQGALEVHRQSLLQVYRQYHGCDPAGICAYYSEYLLRPEAWHVSDYMHELGGPISLPALAVGVRRALSRVWVEVLVHGKIEEREASQAANFLFSALDDLDPEGGGVVESTPVVVMLPTRVPTVVELDVAAECPIPMSSCTENIYQVGPLRVDLHRDACLQVVCHLAGISAYEQLRMREQLGYLVEAGPWLLEGVAGLRIVVQGSRLAPDQVDCRIEAWLEQGLRQELEVLTQETFEKYRTALVGLLLKRDERLAQETARIWGEIQARRYGFCRAPRDAAAALGLLRCEDVIVFFDSWLGRGAPFRRKLSTRALGNDESRRGRKTGVASVLRALCSSVMRSPHEIFTFRCKQDVFRHVLPDHHGDGGHDDIVFKSSGVS